MIDGAAGALDDGRRVVEPAVGRVRVNALRLACDRTPSSGLFGIGAPARSGER